MTTQFDARRWSILALIAISVTLLGLAITPNAEAARGILLLGSSTCLLWSGLLNQIYRRYP